MDVRERRNAPVRLGVRIRESGGRVPAARLQTSGPGARRAERPLSLRVGQEAFLVLSGECTLLVEGEGLHFRPWDFFHSPAGTGHIFVGAGDGPCVILMTGARSKDFQLLYPVSELAASYGASVAEETSDQTEAKAGFERLRRERPSYWDRLPWA